MYDTYKAVVERAFPEAVVAVDSFHVIKNLNACLNNVRIKVMNSLIMSKKSKSEDYWFLKRFWKLLLKSNVNMFKTRFVGRMNMKLSNSQIIEYMLRSSDELREAYCLKNEYRDFNDTGKYEFALETIEDFIERFKASGITEYIPFYKMLKRWKYEITNSFIRINGFRLSNGPIERLNRDVKALIQLSFGACNFVRFRTRLMYTQNTENVVIIGSGEKKSNKISRPKRGPYKKNKNN